MRRNLSSVRSYSSPRREAEAAETRTRIIDAAARLFARDGYVATPMRAIAVEAEISVQTVNLAGPKSSLLLAAFERTFAGDEGQQSLSERPMMAEIISTPDVGEALGKYVAFLASANERAAGIWRAFVAAADADEVVRTAAADLEKRRRADMMLASQFLLSRGLIALDAMQRTADIFGFLTAPESYLYFVEDSGWSRAEYETWLRSAIMLLVAGASRPLEIH